jgi:hypothetical protein
MATEAQILANRRNALKSTGPKTRRGKVTACQNAVRHGLSARRTIIGSEDQAEFDRHRKQFLAELAPQTPMESMLAERIIILSWRLKRAVQIQNQTIDALNARNSSGPLTDLQKSLALKLPQLAQSDSTPELALGRIAIKDFSNARVLERLLMYERRIENSLYKTIIELQRLTLIRGLNSGAANPLKQFLSTEALAKVEATHQPNV